MRKLAANGLPVLLMGAVMWFAVYAALRGVSVVSVAEQTSSRLFHPGAWLGTGAIYAHMVVGGAITALAPVQLIPALRRRWPRLHHRIGYTVAFGAIVTSVAGLIYIAAHGTIGGAPMSLGFALYGALMLGAALKTLQTARTRTPAHVEWAARLIVLILGSYLYRVHYGINYAIFGGVATNEDFTGTFDLIQNVAFYLPYLALLELFLRIRRARGVSAV